MSTSRGLFSSPGRFIAQSRYVLVDYLLLRASIPVLALGFIGYQIARQFTKYPPKTGYGDVRWVGAVHSNYVGVSTVLLYFAMMLAIVAIMTVDRTTGYYRFFFSKPVNVVHYYLHTFAMHGAAVCALLAAGALGWNSLMPAANPHESLHLAAVAGLLAFLLMGGLGFAFGALTNIDAAVTPLAFIFAASTQSVIADYGTLRAPMWLKIAGNVLPPVTQFEKSRRLLYDAHPLVSAQLWPVVLWGVAGWILGVVFLRWRSLAR